MMNTPLGRLKGVDSAALGEQGEMNSNSIEKSQYKDKAFILFFHLKTLRILEEAKVPELVWLI